MIQFLWLEREYTQQRAIHATSVSCIKHLDKTKMKFVLRKRAFTNDRTYLIYSRAKTQFYFARVAISLVRAS